MIQLPTTHTQNMYSFKMLFKNISTHPEIHLHKSFSVQTTSSQHCIIHSSGEELNESTAIFTLCFKTHFMSTTAVWVLLRKTQQFPQRVQNNNTQANRGYEPTIPCKYDTDFCLQCTTASKPGSETSISGLKINKWAEEAPLLCRGRTRSVLSPKISQYTGTPREVQAERTFHIWMTETFNHVINIHHHSIFYSSFNHRINTKLRERSKGAPEVQHSKHRLPELPHPPLLSLMARRDWTFWESEIK